MTPFVNTNEIIFCITMITYLIVSLVGIICLAMSISYKLKLQYVLPEFIVSIISTIFFCYLSDGIEIRYFNKNINDYTYSLCFMPTLCVITISILLLTIVIFLLTLVVKKRLSSLTAMSIKEAITQLPVSLCFYDETGRMLLLNEKILNDCKELTGEPLYDGNEFWTNITSNKVINSIQLNKTKDSIIIAQNNGHVTLFKRIIHNFDNKIVYEICGTNISREFALKKEIEQKNENLVKMNLRLKQYSKIVTEVTKEKEMLATRIKVHNNLGSLILRTKKAISQGEYDSSSLILQWNTILSLIFASNDNENDRFVEIDKTAASIGVIIIYEGKYPKKGTYVEKIFATAIFECLINTARHANGTKLYVKMIDDTNIYSINLTNNGIVPTKDIKEGGGLSSLRSIVENAYGHMIIQSLPKFSLTITIPKEEKKYE